MDKLFSLILSLSLLLSPLNGVAGEVDAYRTKNGAQIGTGTDAGEAFYIQQMAMLSGSIVGANLFTCIPASYHWSHYVFAAGGASYIAQEIANIGETND